MKASYQHADAATMLKVVENAPPGHTADTPAETKSSGETG
jgi:hypothetical protein